jgi:hypothetical protein
VLIWAGALAIATGLSGLTRLAGGATGMVVKTTLPLASSPLEGGVISEASSDAAKDHSRASISNALLSHQNR